MEKNHQLHSPAGDALVHVHNPMKFHRISILFSSINLEIEKKNEKLKGNHAGWNARRNLSNSLLITRLSGAYSVSHQSKHCDIERELVLSFLSELIIEQVTECILLTVF